MSAVTWGPEGTIEDSVSLGCWRGIARGITIIDALTCVRVISRPFNNNQFIQRALSMDSSKPNDQEDENSAIFQSQQRLLDIL